MLRQCCLLSSLGIISLADTTKIYIPPHNPQAIFTSAPSHSPLAAVTPYLHQVGHRRTEVLGDHGQQQGVMRQNFMPKESSPCDLGGRAQKLGGEEEKQGNREGFQCSTANIKCCYQKAIANYTNCSGQAKAPCRHNLNFQNAKSL